MKTMFCDSYTTEDESCSIMLTMEITGVYKEIGTGYIYVETDEGTKKVSEEEWENILEELGGGYHKV